MMIADPNPPLMEEVTVERIRGGEPTTAPLWVEYHAAYLVIPSRLILACGWNGYGWRERDEYGLNEVGGGDGVRRFRLGRDAHKLLETPPGGDRSPFYEVSIGPRSGWCSCRGFTLGNEQRLPCKHVAAVAHLVTTGVLSNEVDDEREADGGGGEAEPGATGPDRQED